jgi:hypothetical protein
MRILLVIRNSQELDDEAPVLQQIEEALEHGANVNPKLANLLILLSFILTVRWPDYKFSFRTLKTMRKI